MVKPSELDPKPAGVRMRRAYFDCTYGQLHVRTAFPATGGFDEQTTLVCLHGREGSSRSFARLLPEMANDRSVYAPDLPGYGESDPPFSESAADAARAVADLARDLRLRHIDVLGVEFGALVALTLAASESDLLRRLVLLRIPPLEGLPAVRQRSLILGTAQDARADDRFGKDVLPNARWLELAGDAADPINAAPGTLTKEISAFLSE